MVYQNYKFGMKDIDKQKFDNYELENTIHNYGNGISKCLADDVKGPK